MNDDPIQFEKVTTTISGDRMLHSYTFVVQEPNEDPQVDSLDVPEAKENQSE